MKVVVACLFLFLTSIAFTQEEYSFDISIKGDYPEEAIKEIEILYKDDQEQLEHMLEQIKLYSSNGIIVLSTKQYEVVKKVYDSFSNKPSTDIEVAEIKRAKSYLNETYILVSEL